MFRRRFSYLLCAFLLTAAVLPITALANSAAPDPIVTVKIKNAPAGPYYLDLVTQEAGERPLEELAEYDPALLAGLFSWTEDDWYPAVTRQWRGGLTDGPAHSFSVWKLPRDFRIAVSTADGAQITQETVHRETYYTTVVYDYAANRIIYITPVWLAYVVQFLCTCIPTLLIEGAMLVFLFRFDWRKNRALFLVLNLVTQVFMAWCMAGQYVGNGDRGYPWMLMIVAEVPIFAAESIACAFGLKGHGRGRRVGYALAANLLSLVFGLIANPTIFRLLQRL